MFHTSKICLYSSSHTFYRCEAPGDNIVHMFTGTCCPGSNNFLVIAVKHIIAQILSLWLAIQI